MKKNMHYRRCISLMLVCFLFTVVPVSSQIMVGETRIDTFSLVTGLDTPWEILWGPDNHIWMTERYGRVSRIDPVTGEVKVVDTIPNVYENQESGLLGMALHRDFTNKPFVYLIYTYQESGSIKERLVRYNYSNGSLITPLVFLNDIQGAPFHIGSRIAINLDNCLFVSTGDATQTSLAQNLQSLSGKILRIRPDGTVPPDNPIPDSYIWSYGHRNPQGLLIAPSGKIYSSEHGPDSDDEINIIKKGENYGWPEVEGYCDLEEEIDFCDLHTIAQPIKAWTPTLAVAGMAFYNHNAIPEWNNSLLVSTLKAGQLVVLKLDDEGNNVLEQHIYFEDWFGRLRDVAISPSGDVYLAVSNRDGRGNPVPGDDRIVRIRAFNESSVPNSKSKPLFTTPNPFTGNELSLQITNNQTLNITIYDQTGREMFNRSFQSGTENVNIEFPYSPGIYFIEGKSGNEREVVRVMKVN